MAWNDLKEKVRGVCADLFPFLKNYDSTIARRPDVMDGFWNTGE